MTTMEELTKTQIILLTLLVSFITSIATGIIASSLLSSAPASVTQTIDRVVQQTIEQVSSTATATPVGTPVHVVTIVKEDDAITSAIDIASKSLVRIKQPPNGDGNQNFYSLGVIVSTDGLVLSDAHNLLANSSYTVVMPDGANLVATVVATSNTDNLALFKLIPDFKHLSFTPIAIAGNDVKLGQSVIALEGQNKNAVAVGRVLSLDSQAGAISTNITPNAETSGSPLINLSGELAGIKVTQSDQTLSPSVYTALTAIKHLLTGQK